jgi:hypothetical protein
MPKKPTRKFLRAQLKLVGRQPKINIDFVIVRVADQLVVDFRAGHSDRQAIRFYKRWYRKTFPCSPIPDITAIERSAFAPDAEIKRGQTYIYNIPRVQ